MNQQYLQAESSVGTPVGDSEETKKVKKKKKRKHDIANHDDDNVPSPAQVCIVLQCIGNARTAAAST